MIIDTSALVALLEQEPEAERIARTLAATPDRLLSAASLVEVGIVMQARHGDDGARDLDLLLAKLHVEVVPLTARQATSPARLIDAMAVVDMTPSSILGIASPMP